MKRVKTTVSFYTLGRFKGDVTVRLISENGSELCSHRIDAGTGKAWKRHDATLTPTDSDSRARFVIELDGQGTLLLDYVSLFPQETFRNRENGLRRDVAETLEALHPAFIRWPGGGIVEGITLSNRVKWKETIGDPVKRPGQYNLWGYRSTYGFGYHEFLQFCEDIGADAMFVCNAGLGGQAAVGDACPEEELDLFIADALDAIDYALGDGTTDWSRRRVENGHPGPFPLKYVEIGNENWGCGGNMRPEYYADVYKRYQTFCRNYSGNRLYRIACGSSSADYNWTEVMMKNLDSNNVDAIDLHYYTMPVWPEMESATDFDDELYYKTIAAANFSDELITRHSEIMNRYDPEKKIGLVIGEWGCWHKVEEGTNPGFLYQQNTMRDAIVAAIELNVFNRHSDRVVMANLAQAVNVLQSVILTEGDKMIKTPTYHVFDLFKTHQNNEAVYCYTQNENMSEGKNAPMISVSASVNEKSMTVTAANCSLAEEAAVECSIFGFKASSVSCRILTNEAHSYNDFDCPDRVSITEHTAVIKDNVLKLNIPPCAVVECVVD